MAITKYFGVALAMVKVAASEDLPVLEPLNLTIATRKPISDKALVLHWLACEIMALWSSKRGRETECVCDSLHANNWVFFVIIAVTIIFQWINVSFLGKLANTVLLAGNQWLITVGIGAGSLLVAAVIKLIPVPARRIQLPPGMGRKTAKLLS
ncbi:unnamed protein product [Calypogeia fissa]